MGGGQIYEALHALKPALLMVVVQIAYAGVNVFYKLAANDGMNLRIIVAYRFVFATAFILPLALFIERKSRPKLTWMVLFQSFLCALFGGALTHNLYIESLNLTSAAFASAMSNLNPAITFVLAFSFRMEKVNIGNLAGKAKVLGTLLGIGGAMILTFYKGVEIDIWSTNVDLLYHGQQKISHVAPPQTDSSNRVWGCVFALGSSTCYSLWLIIQAKMNEKYPCFYSSTALMSTMGMIQTVGFALCTERDLSQWKLGWNIRLLSVSYSGVMASGVAVTLVAWCVHARGPVFASVFNPLMLLLVAIAGSLVLDEKLHLGSVLGSIPIVIGLYMVLWGKNEETKKIIQLAPSDQGLGSRQKSIEIVVSTSPTADNNKTCITSDNNNNNSTNNGSTTSINNE
ncbi:Auxin-induced protein 5NG4 [Morus notabilis]|uniref:WAT1-related protein n=1 Tax=Morus notabilis TaxID=981085 RepID=W9RV49_9ROSA|nr:WAT1-related protein At1g25270 [Morus notabilis]EXB97309.1 Auxin-induced protein 5NG4 [Morus notabilis]